MKRVFFVSIICLLACAANGQVIPGVVSSSKNITVIPHSPLEVSAEAISNTEVNLTWVDNSHYETGYIIERSLTSGSGFAVLTTTAADVESYSDTGLAPETVYYYRIKATGDNGDSDYSDEASTITPIAPPTNVVAATVDDDQINLTWDDNSGIETGYEIERSTTSGTDFTLIHTTAANVESYSVTGLTENTAYYFRIRAIGTVLNSAYTAEFSATTSPALNAPSGLTAVAVSSSQINLEWVDNATNETGFQLERSTTSGSGFSTINSPAANATTYSNTGLTASTTYYYRIKAVNASGSTAYSAEASATTTAVGTVPNAPTGLTVSLTTNPTTSSAGGTISWTDNSSNETGFQVERSTDTNTSFALVTTTAANATSYTETALNEGRRYYYRVRAVNGSGNSSYTSQANDLTTWSSPIALVSNGTASSSATSTLNITLPSHSTGNMIVLLVGTKTQQVRAQPPTGYAEAASYLDNTNANSTDTGPIRISVFYRIATSSSETNPVITLAQFTANSAYGKALVFSKDSHAFWSVDFSGGSHNTLATTSYEAISWKNLTLNKGDVVVPASSINSNGITWSTQSISHPYATLTATLFTLLPEIFDSGTSDGNDQQMTASMYTVSNNSSSTAAKATFTMLGSTSTASAPVGVTAFIRLRNARTTSTSVTNPPLRIWRASEVVDVIAGGDGTPVFDGLRVSSFGPDPGTTKYSVATFNGRPCLKLVADFTSGINYRTELHENSAQPNYPIGTQLIQEVKFETDATVTPSNGEWLLMQNHPGTAPGFSSNSPLLQVAFTFNGQTGFDNSPGTSSGGQLEFINSVDDPDISNTVSSPVQYDRYRFTGYDWAPNSVYRIRLHVRWDVKTGSPVTKMWASKNGSAMTLLYENYTLPNVFLTDAEAGSASLVGGTQKFGVYEHSTKTEAARAAQVAAGHTGTTLYIPAVKQIIMLPGDANYFTDWTNNSASIYNLVDTSTE